MTFLVINCKWQNSAHNPQNSAHNLHYLSIIRIICLVWSLHCILIMHLAHTHTKAHTHSAARAWSRDITVTYNHQTASSSSECSWDKPPFNFVRGQDLTMWDIVWVSPQGHRSVSVSRHFLLQALQCPSSMQKRFRRDHCCRGRSKPGCRIVGSHTRWELTSYHLSRLPVMSPSTFDVNWLQI